MVTVNLGVPGFGKGQISYASITTLGEQKLDAHEVTGIKAQILQSIKDRESASLDEIVKDVQPSNPAMNKENIRDFTNQLFKAQFISIR